MTTHVLILCGGPVFETNDSSYPLYMTEVAGGMSLLETIVNNTRHIPDVHYVFALLSKDIARFHLKRVIELLHPSSTLVCLPESTQGSACTALLAASQLNSDDKLLVVSANEFVDVDLAPLVGGFCERGLDAATLTFRSLHPRYSYVRLNEQGLVIEAAQQDPISHHATVGVFWFVRVADFVEAAKRMIRKGASVNGSYFVAPTFNELVLQQRRIGVAHIENGKYHPLKSVRQVQQFDQGIL